MAESIKFFAFFPYGFKLLLGYFVIEQSLQAEINITE